MKKRTPTPAEIEEDRRKRRALWWRKVIVYYLNQQYHIERELEIAKYHPGIMLGHTEERIREHGLLAGLYLKNSGQLSPLQLLERMKRFEEEDSPFLQLLHDMRDHPREEGRISRALNRCIEEAPQRILERTGSLMPDTSGEPDPEKAARLKRENLRLKYEMTFLRSLLPPELFAQLCDGLTAQGRLTDRDRDFLFVPERSLTEEFGLEYDDYVSMHSAEPEEMSGELGNSDRIFTAAARMIAAYEQKDEEFFNEKAADARAMALAGSRAFRAYMQDHPGALLAAARNTGLEATHRELLALDAQLTARDNTLRTVLLSLRASATGKSAAYHQMTNAVGRFLQTDGEPSKQEKDDLAMHFARYVMTEGIPGDPGYDRKSALLAAGAVGALLPEKDFSAFLAKVNASRDPGAQIRSEDISALFAGSQPDVPETNGPEYERSSL